MPELPDVEMFKQYLDATALHQKIQGVDVKTSKIMDKISMSKFSDFVKGKSFESTFRYGKHLFTKTGSKVIRMHFGMTGSLRYFKDQNEEFAHVRLLFIFSNGYRLAYISQRMLGRVGLEDSIDAYIERKKIGPDALQISLEDFKKAAKSTTKAVKSFLMDQNKLAGLGNIYSDEILFQSGVYPQTRGKDLNDSRIKNILQNIHKVSDYAVKHKANPETFGKNYLLPQRRKGAKCPKCGGAVKQIKITGRSTYFCPKCQKK